MDFFDIAENMGGFAVSARILPLGADMLVVLTGGRAHIGAVAIAQPRPSISDARMISSTSSVFTRVGHKEDIVAKAMSEELSRALNRVVAVVAGLHWDGMKAAEIGLVVEMCGRITKRIIAETEKA
jgi:hypothetical protein